MPLSYEDFKKMRSQGMSVDDIAKAPSAPGPLQQVTSGVVRQLPIIGGTIGTVATPEMPGLGTFLGAAGGRAIQQMIPPDWGGQAQPQNLGDVGTNMLQQVQSGATNTALAQGPERLFAELRPVAQRLAAASMAKYARDPAQLGKTAVKERIAPRFLAGMGKKADALVERLRGDVNERLLRARAEGRWQDPREIAAGADKVLQNEGLDEADKRTVQGWTDKYLEGKTWETKGGKRTDMAEPRPVPPDVLNKKKQEWGDIGRGVIKARQAGLFVPPGKNDLFAKWGAAMSENAGTLLHDTETLTPSGMTRGVPGLREAHRALSEAMSLRDAIKPGERNVVGRLLPYAPAGGGAVLGATLLPANDWHQRILHGALLGAALSRQGLGSAALTLANPNIAPLLSNLLRGSGAVADATMRPTPGTAP